MLWMYSKHCLIVLLLSFSFQNVYPYEGVQIFSNFNDVILEEHKNFSCSGIGKEVKVNDHLYCGIECEKEKQSIYNGRSICTDDSSILTENACLDVGVTNNVKTDRIQTVALSKLLDDLYIYYKDELTEDIKAAYTCNFQNDVCSIYKRNKTKGDWGVPDIAACFLFAANSAHLQFTCAAVKAKELEGSLLKIDLSCHFTKEAEARNKCVIFKVEGTQLEKSNNETSIACPFTPTVVLTTLLPASDDYDASGGWIIMSIVIFVLLLILMAIIKWMYMRGPRAYIVKKLKDDNEDLENQVAEHTDNGVVSAHDHNSNPANKNTTDGINATAAFTNKALDITDERPSNLNVTNNHLPSYAKVMREKIKRPKPPRTFSKKHLINNDNEILETNQALSKSGSPYEEIHDAVPKIVVQTDDSNSTISRNSTQINFYEEIPLKQVKPISKPKRKKFDVKTSDDGSSSENYLSPQELLDEKNNKNKSSPLRFWKSQALKRQNFFKENSLLKQLQKKRTTLSSENSDERKDDTLSLEMKKKSIASANNDDVITVSFDIGKPKHVYTNKDTVLPVKALQKFDDVDAFTRINSEKSNNHSNSVNKTQDGKLTIVNGDTSESNGSEKSDDIGTPPLLPGKHRAASWYGNNDVIMDKMYMKPPKLRSLRSRSDGSTPLYYDMIPTIKGDKKSSIKINFRRPIPTEVDLIRLPYSQFNYGLRKRHDGNSSCNGFCLLLANYFLESPSLDISDLRLELPNILYKAEKVWNEGNLSSTSVEEAHEILEKLHLSTYRVKIGEELFWSIHQGLGGFSPFQALHEIYDKCVNSTFKECLILTFYPDKSCVCLFDEFGNQAFIDLHIHFKSNHQKRGAALHDKECGGVICKAAKHTSDALLNFIISNMCLEMKADPNTGSAYPLSLRKDYDII